MHPQVSQAKAAISKEQRLKEQLREQMAAAADDSKRQVTDLQQAACLDVYSGCWQEANISKTSSEYATIHEADLSQSYAIVLIFILSQRGPSS